VNIDYSQSLLSFLNDIVTQRLIFKTQRILDIGSGGYSIFEMSEISNKTIEAIDLKSYETKDSKIQYAVEDITQKNAMRVKQYGLVFDSHCLHCLNSLHDQKLALKNIFSYMSVEGIFASEIMVQPSKAKVSFPQRTILEARDVENLLIESGFKIKYFIIVPQMSFYYEENGTEITCDMLRIIATK